MSNNPEFEQRINNQLATIAENQARFDERQAAFDRNMATMMEAIAGMIQVARNHEERLDRADQQIAELREGLREQKESVDALIRIVEGHISNHP